MASASNFRLSLTLSALTIMSSLGWAAPAGANAPPPVAPPGKITDRRSPAHAQTLASPHIAREHGGLDIRVGKGRVVVRSYARREAGWAIDKSVVPVQVIEDADAAAARDSFHVVRRAMIVHGHWKLGNEKIVDLGLDAATKQANGGATKLSELYTAAADRIVEELKALDPWTRLETRAAHVARTTPAANNVTTHRLPGDVLAVKIRRFRGPVSIALRDELTRARRQGPLRGLILDLRDNGGGLVDEAQSLLSQFLPDQQPLLTTEHGRLGRPIKSTVMLAQAPAGGPDTALPIRVLVNGRSASASELTVGVLKDLGRAQLYGDKTYGKGVGQLSRGLPDGRLFQQTEWRRVLKGLGPYHGIGIEPDVSTQQAVAEVDAAAASGRIRARGDRLLRAALLSLWAPPASALN